MSGVRSFDNFISEQSGSLSHDPINENLIELYIHIASLYNRPRSFAFITKNFDDGILQEPTQENAVDTIMGQFRSATEGNGLPITIEEYSIEQLIQGINSGVVSITDDIKTMTKMAAIAQIDMLSQENTIFRDISIDNMINTFIYNEKTLLLFANFVSQIQNQRDVESPSISSTSAQINSVKNNVISSGMSILANLETLIQSANELEV